MIILSMLVATGTAVCILKHADMALRSAKRDGAHGGHVLGVFRRLRVNCSMTSVPGRALMTSGTIVVSRTGHSILTSR